MKLLVVGSGGREHAIAKKLLESKDVEQVFVAPGNDGMTLDGLDLINIGISEHSKLIDFAKANDIAWTFIGPDDALAAGIVDDFNAAGLKAFGPTKAAAELEWSKDFAKVWSSRNSWTGKSSLSLPLSMGTSSTLCQRPKTTNVLMMVTRDLTLVGWVPMRQFLTCHRVWLTQRLTLLSSRFLKA